MQPQKTVFIAYRRTNIYIARAIYQNLRQHGFDAFIDYESIDSGDFDKIILNQISARAHFLILLTPGSVERLAMPGDWLRREIEHALKMKRNIVPLMMEDFDFRDAEIHFTGALAVIPQYNAIRVIPDYFDEVMMRLRERFLNKPIEAIPYPDSSVDDSKDISSSDLPPELKISSPPQELIKDESYKPNLRTKKILRDQVFISYSHSDKDWLTKFRTVLRPLEKSSSVRVWADTEIKVGDKWREKIEEALVSAKIAVLLVSPNFLASDFINEEELPRILEASEKEGLIIIWLPISASLYNMTFIGNYQSAHDPSEPLDALSVAEQNKVFVKIANVIVRELNISPPSRS